MPCFRCGARQTDPVRGASPWKRGVRHDVQVLICPDCQRAHDLDLDTCATCGSTAMICRLGEVECRSCGAVRPARSRAQASSSSVPGLAAEVEAALNRVLGRVRG
ncbi:hypothetical protein TBS_13620 [Thermobispora bispora]|jgi:hypothetical protein|uniref:Uncharacterized protein n=1 Tax=Thermobispora bispora (strain ATCC 19993 / DSM 43833 / CBS 139.67 / JCM 10125 / KCTC 9307 / NBRC 14880 / R51) TaxID=469371 RepID=D6Y3V9_THEBD|nr:hypothetical protein [Thermobispora bispora]MBO2474383.1 hypothetical protein [Actinomycetales bacterium]MDI9582460.1 hypothetical protein [Thermobispora sp.]ADG89061.1 hypothetical protein Tbis_2355 [Thermobispora bispora DSM 43833]MBX6167110.1 hypothetical protein [Thermobispora bispora]QSI48784.1 hypothetical protein CYL17_13700 [Thermobispora bispora]